MQAWYVVCLFILIDNDVNALTQNHSVARSHLIIIIVYSIDHLLTKRQCVQLYEIDQSN